MQRRRHNTTARASAVYCKIQADGRSTYCSHNRRYNVLQKLSRRVVSTQCKLGALQRVFLQQVPGRLKCDVFTQDKVCCSSQLAYKKQILAIVDVFIVATSNKHVDVVSCCVPIVNRLECKANYSATSNNVKLVHWPLIGGLLHLVQRRGDWARPQPAQAQSSLYQM